MYRVFCESYKNYLKVYAENNHIEEYRHRISIPFELIVNVEKYFIEKEKESFIFKQLSDLLFYMESNIPKYPMFKAFLWTIESRGLKGHFFGIVPDEDLIEQAKLVKMFLSLMYWDESV